MTRPAPPSRRVRGGIASGAPLDSERRAGGAESAQDGEAADAGGLREVSQAGAFGCMLGEELGGGGDDSCLRVGPRDGAIGLASLARAIACLLGRDGAGKEADVLLRRTAAGA